MAETLLQYAAMVPNKKRRGVVEAFAKENPILEVMRFQDIGDAKSYEYDVEAALGGIGFRALNGDYDDSAKTTGVVNPVVESTAIMGGEVNIDRDLAKNATYKGSKTSMKAKAAAKFFCRQFFDGNRSTEPRGFEGLNRRLTGPNLTLAGTNGGLLDLDVLSACIDFVPGEAAQKRLIMGDAMRRLLGAMIRAQGATQVQMTEWEGSIKPKAFDGVPILDPSEDESGNKILAFDETCGTSSVTGSIYVVRFGQDDEEYVVGLARKATEGVFEVEDQGVAGTTNKVLVEGRVGMALHHPKCADRYTGILNALA